MTATIDTLTTPSEIAGRETISPPEAKPASTSRRATLGWVAVPGHRRGRAVVVAAFTGSGDNGTLPVAGWGGPALTYPGLVAVKQSWVLEK